MKERKNYEKEFKLMAVELMNSGKTSIEVGEELDIAPDLVRRWRREYLKFNSGSFSGNGVPNMTPEQKEIVKLKKELADAKLDAEILKKAISIFSKKDRTNTSL
jgi:transposase